MDARRGGGSKSRRSLLAQIIDVQGGVGGGSPMRIKKLSRTEGWSTNTAAVQIGYNVFF